MLAVQHPRMGSSQPPNGRLPFGYLSEDPISDSSIFDVLPGPPPEPAPGNPILTTAETNGLASMLAAMTSNAYGEHNFGEGITGDDWMMPPSLMGTATSFGLQPHIPMPSDGMYNNAFFQPTAPQSFAVTDSLLAPATSATAAPDTYSNTGHPRSQSGPLTTAPHAYATAGAPLASPGHQHPVDHQQPSADVLEAANSLMQGGSHGRSLSLQHEPTFSNGPQKTSTMGPPVGHLRHQQWSEFRQEGRRMSQSNHAAEQEAVLATWMYGPDARSSHRQNAPPAPIDLQYGTDQNFSNKNRPFVPPSEKESTEAIHQDHLRYLNAFRLPNSANTTRPSSPVYNGEEPSFNLKTRAPPPIKVESNGDSTKKWRKNKRDEDEDDEDEPQSAVSKTSARKRKQKGEVANSPGAEGAGSGKRRKSSAAVKRENLTEDQKRENHINSEKKRRKVIQVGFENLSHIVPDIKGGNPSKSAMLEATVAWLQDLLDGNETLKAQMSQL
ncbi:hypothetical protein VM1G_03232 [Cytospora mali]|uniref:BHLH domain-containing protein n=1 Tax=Cytospora mali TaxID=578113 RepID=A0A194VSB7_CYTMA|nr:hypothetical protein VM1G_03232 [Valsa mali]